MKVLFRIVLLVLSFACPSFAACNSICQQAFDFVVSHEDRHLTGVISREPLGGVARFGVNSRAHPEAVRDRFYRMSRVRALAYAQRLFYSGYWVPMRCDDIRDTRLAMKVADMAYSVGTGRATKLLKHSVAEFGVDPDIDVMYSVNMFPADGVEMILKYQIVDFYTRMARKHVACRRWKKVWLARAMEG